MPKRRKKLDLSSLYLNRTVGLELEGYLRTNPRTVIDDGGIPHCDIRRDGSLFNSNWRNSSSTYGVEVVTDPLSDLEPLEEILKEITSYGWSASGRASLHVHVDTSDFTMQDKLKAAYFGKKVEDVMMLFTKNRRYDNRYCRLLPNFFEKLIYEQIGESDTRDIYTLYRYIERTKSSTQANNYLDRYRWINIFNSSNPTIEFRMFHPIRTAEDGGKFAYLVHNFVNVVKHSSIEQLEFIAESIEEEPDIQLKARKLLDSLGIPYELPILNQRAIVSINNKQRQNVLQLVQ
jgi:hypothetical protein